MSKRSITFFNLWVLFAGMLNFQPVELGEILHGGMHQEIHQETLAHEGSVEYNHIGHFGDNDYAQKFDALPITLHPGSEFVQGDKPTPRSLNHCKSLVYRTLQSLPKDAVRQLKNLTLYFSATGNRGFGGGSTIILRCSNVSDEELVGVLVHEMGHVTDTGLLQGNEVNGLSDFKDGNTVIYNDDPSLNFYRLDFASEKSFNKTVKPLDFVSGYALSDPFEDFAESYAYYVLHGNDFRELIKSNEVLLKKYLFLKTRVFSGKEFFNGDTGKNGNVAGDAAKVELDKRDYDTTVLHYDLTKFFAAEDQTGQEISQGNGNQNGGGRQNGRLSAKKD